jgi:hypothetical protein
MVSRWRHPYWDTWFQVFLDGVIDVSCLRGCCSTLVKRMSSMSVGAIGQSQDRMGHTCIDKWWSIQGICHQTSLVLSACKFVVQRCLPRCLLVSAHWMWTWLRRVIYCNSYLEPWWKLKRGTREGLAQIKAIPIWLGEPTAFYLWDGGSIVSPFGGSEFS